MSTSVLLSCLLVFVWDHKVIYDAFLQEFKLEEVIFLNFFCFSLYTYNSCLLLIKIALVLLYTFLAAKKDKAISKIIGTIDRSLISLIFVAKNVIVTGGVSVGIKSRVHSFGVMR